eukprot:TRINITY_DN102640_c0_g1_i1.p1 TRINITY_DN102640_c0_g1~~TRINITY_DN102640_c0_g1_i1.p1  ORF type:complete len:284 (-),score=112.84 TRINITY_DN102640_c0_g1_i1:70-921(-)
MGAGASAKYKEASAEDKKAAIENLSDEEKKELLESLKAPTTEKVADNKQHIKENKARLNELESAVYANKQRLYVERAFIEENRMLILKNYSAAFMGNRQMANQNTDDIFRNRKAIIKHVKPADAVQLNFVESHTNRARIDQIEHRANMNSKVASVNEKMAKINALLIEVNHDIMEANKEVVEFNSKHSDVNTKLLAGEMAFEGCDPESNAKRIEDNKTRIEEIEKVAKANLEKHAGVLKEAEANRAKILENAKEIYDRRAEIAANHEKIASNAHKISEWILKE